MLALKGADPTSAATEGEVRKIVSIGECSRSSKPPIEQFQDVDPRQVLLLRGAIRHELVEREEIEVDEAFDQLIDQFLHIIFPLPALDQWAEALWGNPGWAEAAREYHRNRELGRRR